jgi:adenylate cyclase
MASWRPWAARNLMADTREIERTFLVDQPPADLGPGRPIRQGYVALDNATSVRVRNDNGRYLLTVKGGAGLDRTEVEVVLSQPQFEALWQLTAGRWVEKRRHTISVPGGIAEIDVFDGPLRGLVMADIEFDAAADARVFKPPAWFGREVTDDPRYGNASLAVDGLPPA